MEAILEKQIKSAVLDWATLTYDNQEIIIGSAAQDLLPVDNEANEDDAGRYPVDYAVRDVGRWLVSEAWLTGLEILSINDMEEELHLDDIRWPWALDGNP